MSDSPRDEVFSSRFSTPVNELDDHRFQPESLPRAEPSAGPQGRRSTRRGTADTSNGMLPPLLQINGDGTVSRDFEQAIVDDDKSENAPPLSAEGSSSHLGTTSPVVARRSTFRRNQNEDIARKSVESFRSRGSLSPPHSVEAFAEPKPRARAGTAGTVNSVSPSCLGGRPRAPSQSTFTRARTFSDDRGTINDAEPDSDQGSVEDDVCFPQPEEPSQEYTIDFDDLQEFITKNRSNTAIAGPLRRKNSFSCRSNEARLTGSAQEKVSKDTLPARSFPGSHFFRRGSHSGALDSETDVDEKVQVEEEGSKEPSNRWSFFSTELEESIHAPDLGDLLMPGETFQHLFELGPAGGCWWLDMLSPTEEEVEVICKAFSIHGLTREDIITQETREKVELFKSYYFVCFRSFYQVDPKSEHYLDPVNVYAVVFREGVLTFTFCPSPHAANVRKRMGRLRDYVSLGADWICYALIDDIVDTFGPVIGSIETETDTIEDFVFTARSEDSRHVLRQIGDTRKKVMSLSRLLGGKADVIKGFAKRCNEQYSVAPRQDVGLYLSDIQDHVVTMMSNLGHFDHMLSRSHANYLAQISVDNIAQGARANEVLSKVTFLATILVPLNLVCGLFGMNVPVPGGVNTGSLGWFFGILGFLVCFVTVCAAVAKKKKFI